MLKEKLFWVEAGLLSIGTFLNGFGDWIIGWAVVSIWSI
jgi:hypothetical protein